MKNMIVAALACTGLWLGTTTLAAMPLDSSPSKNPTANGLVVEIASQKDNVRVKRNYNQQNLGYIPGNVWSPYGRVDCIGWWKKLPSGRLRCMGQIVPAD